MIPRRGAVLALAVVLWVVLAPVAARAADPLSLDEYAADIEDARRAVNEVEATQLTDREATDLAIRVNTRVPITVQVQTPTGIVEANHTLVRSLVAQLDSADTAEERTEIVEQLDAQLTSLASAVGRPGEAVPEDSAALAELTGEQPVQSRTSFQKALAELIDRLGRWLQKWWESLGASPGARTTLTTLTVAFVVAMALFLAVVLARLAVRLRAGYQKPEAGGGGLAAAGDAIVEAARDLPADALAYADERAAAGDLREAVRALFGGAARGLQEAGFIITARTRTNRELLLEVRPRSEAVHAPLEALSREFERAWYGHRDVSEEGYSASRERFVEIRTRLAEQGGERP